MAVDFDNFPFYDPLLKGKADKMSHIWNDSLTVHIQTLTEYLTQFGIFVPRITMDQRNSIQSPVNGQMIYNTSIDKFQGFQAGAWVNFV